MARTAFDSELEHLHVDLMKMGALIEQAITNSIKAFLDNDDELARETAQSDRAVNDMERSIEARALSLMLKQQPVACDLRSISAALKVVTDMERIGDHAVDIADLILRFTLQKSTRKLPHVTQMAQLAKYMVNQSVSAFTTGDLVMAAEIEKKDDEMDLLFNEAKNDIIASLRTDHADVDACVDLLMIIKYFERIGDHAVNICEWAEFQKNGTLKNERLL